MAGIAEWLFFFVGFWMIVQVSINICHFLKVFFIKSDISQYCQKSWALVTGASDGLGLSFSDFLASQGINIILIGRNQEKLEKVSDQLKEKYSIQTRIIVKDFSQCTKDPIRFFIDIKEQTTHLDVSILVNNVGTGAGLNWFTSVPEEMILKVNSLNLWPSVFLTKLYLPDMLLRKQRSAIINISSSLALLKIQKRAIYNTSKSFMHFFSMAISEEVKFLSTSNKGMIDVMSVLPGCIDTNLIKNIEVKPLLVIPKDCAFWICKSLGSLSYTGGHWKHQCIHLLWTFFGDWSFKINTYFARFLQKSKIKII